MVPARRYGANALDRSGPLTRVPYRPTAKSAHQVGRLPLATGTTP